MCGIAGLVRLSPDAAPLSKDILSRMGDAIAHRGPDGAGTWVNEEATVGLSHRRLSIVDLSSAADQPMHDASGRFVIVFNGEIYNHRELRRALEAGGTSFKTDHSDTEVLIEGYRAWGLEGLLSRLEGMFAFALFDREKDTLFIVRDRVGIKPVYVMEHDGRLAFASEIKSLLALPGVTPKVDIAAFRHYLSFLVAPAPATLFSGIAKLPAGTAIVIGRDRKPEARRWWSPCDHLAPPRGPSVGDYSAAVRHVRALVEDSVEKHMAADVPVGVFLSGGVDSGAVLALASRFATGPVCTYTVGFKDENTGLDETDEARRMAELFKSRHSEVRIGVDEAEASLEAIVRHQDEPLADWVCVPLWHVAKLARDGGTKAILVGEGADELFFGYRAYAKYLAFAERMERIRRFLPQGMHRLVRLASSLVPSQRLGLLGLLDHMERGLGGGDVFWTGAIAYWPSQKRTLFRGGYDAPAPSWIAYGLRHPSCDDESAQAVVSAYACPRARQSDATRHMLAAELQLRLPELLLMRVDKMTMAHSLESRVPFLDHRLVEYMLGRSRDEVLPQGRLKGLLKDALVGIVPDEVLNRPKRGFGAPVGRWLQGAFGQRMEHAVLNSALCDETGLDRDAIRRLFAVQREGRRDVSLHLWPLINAALWHRSWISP